MKPGRSVDVKEEGTSGETGEPLVKAVWRTLVEGKGEARLSYRPQQSKLSRVLPESWYLNEEHQRSLIPSRAKRREKTDLPECSDYSTDKKTETRVGGECSTRHTRGDQVEVH